MMQGFFDGMEKASLDNMPIDLKTAYLQERDSNRLKIMFECALGWNHP